MPASGTSSPTRTDRTLSKSPPERPKLKDRRFLFLREVFSGLQGAKLCYGEPVRVGDRVVVPVARVTTAGGGGFGSGAGAPGVDGAPGSSDGTGGGGGGWVEAAPVGFIDVGPEGARFEPIPDPVGTARGLRLAITGLTTLAGAVAGFRALRQPRRAALPSPRGLLRR